MELDFRIATTDDIDAVVALVESAYRGGRAAATWSSEADLIGGQRVDAAMARSTIDDPDAVVVLLYATPAPSDTSGPNDTSAANDTSTQTLVGCCEVRRPDARGHSELGMFAVDPDRQAGGLGRTVLAEGERVATDWGAAAVELHVIDLRDELIAWYVRRGYRRTGEHLPFPYGDDRFGAPKRDDLRFEVLLKDLPVR